MRRRKKKKSYHNSRIKRLELVRTSHKSRMPKLLTVKELSEIIDIHPQTVYQLIYRKKIPFIKKRGIGYRFRMEDIENWITQDHHPPDSGSPFQK